ncbi:MAG: ABC-2 transporter permease [Oscillospiraceae bacterium]|jgi:hypothetical protein|nr:ABC-2 transporter permease [Oscillospiraceae bacterium]
MHKLGAFIRLDFGTIKPYLTIKSLLIFGAVALFLSSVNGSMPMSIGIGFMLGTLFIGYPFAIGEKCNLDALYTTLAIDRKTVVLGRYLFALLLNAFCVLFSAVFAALGVFGTRALGIFQGGGGGSVGAITLLAGLLLLVQMLQLPMFFKLGYTRAKFMNLLPFALIMAAFSAFTTLARDAGLGAGLSDALPTPIIIAVLALVTLCSYRWSVSTYSKRPF